jgi:hypothetical protein
LPVDELLTADVQQPAAAAFGGRVLGDQFGRKGKVEVVDGQRHGSAFVFRRGREAADGTGATGNTGQTGANTQHVERHQRDVLCSIYVALVPSLVVLTNSPISPVSAISLERDPRFVPVGCDKRVTRDEVDETRRRACRHLAAAPEAGVRRQLAAKHGQSYLQDAGAELLGDLFLDHAAPGPAEKPPEKRVPKVRKSSFLGLVKGGLKVCDELGLVTQVATAAPGSLKNSPLPALQHPARWAPA